MNKLKLKEIISNIDGNYDYNELYYKLIVLQNIKSDFNLEDFNELVYRGMYLYHLEHGIEKLRKNGSIPKLFDMVNSYGEFRLLLNKYKDIPFKNAVLSNIENAFQELYRLAMVKIICDDGDWIIINSSTIYNREINIEGKLYLSIDNSSLFKFTYLLLEECVKEGLNDFEFKTNGNDAINRRDNVVIYFTKENLNKYLSIIHKILNEHPEIKQNDSHLLGIELDNGIVMAKDFGTDTSFTEKIVKTILELKRKKYNDDEIVECVESMVDGHLQNITKLVEEKANKISK